MDHDLDQLKSEVAATMGASRSVEVLINGIADHLVETMLADGLGNDSNTAKFVRQLRAEAPRFAHLAEIGTIDNSVS